MEDLKISGSDANHLLQNYGRESLGDAISDPLNDIVRGIVEQMADVAKAILRKRDGLPPDAPHDDSPLPKNSVLRQARTAKELGLDESTAMPWTPEMDAKVPKR